jgi:hypothetical protein
VGESSGYCWKLREHMSRRDSHRHATDDNSDYVPLVPAAKHMQGSVIMTNICDFYVGGGGQRRRRIGNCPLSRGTSCCVGRLRCRPFWMSSCDGATGFWRASTCWIRWPAATMNGMCQDRAAAIALPSITEREGPVVIRDSSIDASMRREEMEEVRFNKASRVHAVLYLGTLMTHRMLPYAGSYQPRDHGDHNAALATHPM